MNIEEYMHSAHWHNSMRDIMENARIRLFLDVLDFPTHDVIILEDKEGYEVMVINAYLN
jgi:hypothetical protein